MGLFLVRRFNIITWKSEKSVKPTKKRLEIHNPVEAVRTYKRVKKKPQRKTVGKKKKHRRKKHAIFPAHYPIVTNHMTIRTKNFLFPFLSIGSRLVDLLNLWAIIATGRGRAASTGETASTWHASTRSTTLALVKLHHDRIGDALQLLLLRLEFVL